MTVVVGTLCAAAGVAKLNGFDVASLVLFIGGAVSFLAFVLYTKPLH